MSHAIAKLALEDGTIYSGQAFGATGETVGEVVFNTSMTGYQEVLTDPSYKGQIVTMTYPLIGNYGVNEEDRESAHPQVEGFIVRELTKSPSNFRSVEGLHEYLARHNIMGLAGIDTRGLVKRLRIHGVLRGVISTTDLDEVSLVQKARMAPDIVGRDLVREVLPERSSSWEKGYESSFASELLPSREVRHHVVALDFGMKWNIPRSLVQVGCKVTVVPGSTPACEILAMNPDGIFLSNGPGDPEAVEYGINTIRELIGSKPIFGICLGHQLTCLALGAKTYKLRFGHRGANQPVLNKLSGHVEITTQNHGFAVDPNSLPPEVEQTHINLNDNTNEGIRHTQHHLFSVQYHPEACAGPHDSSYLFEDFVKLMS
ncbi:MAG: glutamine-hydrolyzing carbamoyl-phosphate synthase small subunit [Gemmataceae bacterium]